MPNKKVPGLDRAEADVFDCHQPMTPAVIQQVANLFLPGRREIQATDNLRDLIEVYKKRGKDLCWLYALLKEASPHVDEIDREWCAIFDDPDFLLKHPGCEEFVVDTDGTRILVERSGQNGVWDVLHRIFDDEQYKYIMINMCKVGFEKEFINSWRQRLGKWVIPLRPEGKPGPFWRDAGRSHEDALIRLQHAFYAAEKHYVDIEDDWLRLLHGPDPKPSLTGNSLVLHRFDIITVANLDGKNDELILLLRIFDDREYKHFMRQPGMPTFVVNFINKWRRRVGTWTIPLRPEGEPVASRPSNDGESLEEELRGVYHAFREAAPHYDAIKHEWLINMKSATTDATRRDLFVFDTTGIRIVDDSIIVLRIFDDREYKHALRHLNQVSYVEVFINSWRQRLGNWIIPLRLEGEPGPFWRGTGRLLAPDMCQACNMLGEAAPHLATIEGEWGDALAKHGYPVPGAADSNSTGGVDGTTILDIVERIFDDDAYKHTMRCAIEVGFAEAFCNDWRQRLGKWVIPLRPEGKPGPFWRDNGVRL